MLYGGFGSSALRVAQPTVQRRTVPELFDLASRQSHLRVQASAAPRLRGSSSRLRDWIDCSARRVYEKGCSWYRRDPA